MKWKVSMAHNRLRSHSLACVALATMAVTVALAWFMVATAGRARLTYGRYLKLRKGMTTAEVEALLGPPTSDVTPVPEPGLDDGYPADAVHKFWDGDGRAVVVIFDGQGRVLDAEFRHSDLDDSPGLLDRLRDLLWP
jgi:hypothetical protein